MVSAALRRFGSGVLPVVVLSVLLLVSLYLMSAATQNSEVFGRVFFILLLINVVALVMLLVLISANLIRLVRQYRRRAAGSRLTVRLVVIFVILALLPVSVVYYFSLGFIQRSIDSWFDVRIEKTLDDTLELAGLVIDERKRELIRRTERMSEPLIQASADNLGPVIINLRKRYDVRDITILDESGHVLAFSSADITSVLPAQPDGLMLQQLQQQGSYIGRDQLGPGSLALRIMIMVPRNVMGQQWILQARYPLSDRINELTDNIELAFGEYRQLTLLREPLKFSFTLTLSLVLLLSCLTAVWAAFFSARGLVAPIRALAIGTRAVAAGDYHKQLPQHSNDELGFLVQSFNDMTRRIALARDEAEKSQQQAERERAYLRTVLGRLSSGVLTLDSNRTIRTANVSTGQVLGVDLKDFVAHTLDDLMLEHEWLESVVAAISMNLDNGVDEWREEIVVFANHGRKVLMCGGAALPGVGGRQAGHVIVFDDVTALVQAQRDAAWGEVARRLAHEIKNPLTPIQLSAERLRQKYLNKMPASEMELLDRLTHTIIQQVEVMKKMVQAFAEYAHAPQLLLSSVSLNDVVKEVLDLYRSAERNVQIKLDLDPAVPMMEVDSGRLRQLLHNLIKNALEAIDDDSPGWICVSTKILDDNHFPKVLLRIEDSGSGIPENILGQVFEPYVSSKLKGSGLGLAIVKKIVEEHAGVVKVYNTKAGGACIDVQFPAESFDHSIGGKGRSEFKKTDVQNDSVADGAIVDGSIIDNPVGKI